MEDHRFVIFFLLVVCLASFGACSLITGVKQSPLGQQLEQRRVLIEQLNSN